MSLLHKTIPANPSEYQKEVLAMKERKQAKHHNSHIRHPIRTARKGYANLSKDAQTYWAQGQQLGHIQMRGGTPNVIHSHQYVANYVKTKVSRKKKIIYGAIIAIVLIIIFVGILG